MEKQLSEYSVTCRKFDAFSIQRPITVDRRTGRYDNSIYTASHGYHPMKQRDIVRVSIGGATDRNC